MAEREERTAVSMHYEEHDRPSSPGPINGSGATRTSAEFERFLRHADRLAERDEAPGSLRAWLELAEAWRITQALRECNGNRSAAARHLGIGRRTLYAKMDKLGITPTWSF